MFYKPLFGFTVSRNEKWENRPSDRKQQAQNTAGRELTHTATFSHCLMNADCTLSFSVSVCVVIYLVYCSTMKFSLTCHRAIRSRYRFFPRSLSFQFPLFTAGTIGHPSLSSFWEKADKMIDDVGTIEQKKSGGFFDMYHFQLVKFLTPHCDRTESRVQTSPQTLTDVLASVSQTDAAQICFAAALCQLHFVLSSSFQPHL